MPSIWVNELSTFGCFLPMQLSALLTFLGNPDGAITKYFNKCKTALINNIHFHFGRLCFHWQPRFSFSSNVVSLLSALAQVTMDILGFYKHIFLEL